MPTIHLHSFTRRQTRTSPFSDWDLPEEEFMAQVHRNFPRAKPGYRPDVLLVPCDPRGFRSGVVPLSPGDFTVGTYEARKSNEEPRRHTYAIQGEKLPARLVEVVLYSHAALAEGGENETDLDYEIVSVNASPEEGEMPIQPSTLIANHLGESGGTSTGMTDAEFVASLKVSRAYWRDKAMLASDEILMHAGQAIDLRLRNQEVKG